MCSSSSKKCLSDFGEFLPFLCEGKFVLDGVAGKEEPFAIIGRPWLEKLLWVSVDIRLRASGVSILARGCVEYLESTDAACANKIEAMD